MASHATTEVRSRVAPEHQPLLLLWKGIGGLLARHGEIRTLFGPASVSADYASLSRLVIQAYLEARHGFPDAVGLVAARTPLSPPRGLGREAGRLAADLPDLDALSTLVGDLEPDGKGLPVLLRHYLGLGGKVLAFNVDPGFAGALDALICAEAPAIEPRTLDRYMGRADAQRYRSLHAPG